MSAECRLSKSKATMPRCGARRTAIAMRSRSSASRSAASSQSKIENVQRNLSKIAKDQQSQTVQLQKMVSDYHNLPMRDVT